MNNYRKLFICLLSFGIVWSLLLGQPLASGLLGLILGPAPVVYAQSDNAAAPATSQPGSVQKITPVTPLPLDAAKTPVRLMDVTNLFLDDSDRTGRVVAAGALVRASRAVAAYSAQGPCRGAAGRVVDLQFAPGDRSASQPGLAVPGFFSGQTATIRGTSAAAPQVARRIAETGTAAAADATPLTDAAGRPWP